MSYYSRLLEIKLKPMPVHQTAQFLVCLYIAMGNYNGNQQHRTTLYTSTDEHLANRYAYVIKRTKEPCITPCFALQIASFCVKFPDALPARAVSQRRVSIIVI